VSAGGERKLPKGWVWPTIGNLLTFNYGKSLPARERKTGLVDVYGSNGCVGTHSTGITRAPTIIIGRKGSIGELHYSNQSCWPIDTTYFVDDFSHLDSQFAYSLLQSLPLQEMNRSSTIPGLNRDDVYELLAPVPPLPEQRRIVAKLDALSARSRRAKEALDAAAKLLERLRQSILASAFRGDLTAEWRAQHPDVEPATELLKRIRAERRQRWEEAELAKLVAKGKRPKDESWTAKYQEPAAVDPEGLPELPEGWCWASVEVVGEVHLGRQRAPQYLTGRYPKSYLRVANIKDDRIDFSDLETMDFDPKELEHYRLLPNDILLSEGQSPELVGQSAIYRGEREDLCFQKTLHRFRRHGSAPSAQFAQLVFRHYLRDGTFRFAASLTVNIAHLTLVRLKPLHFPLPPREEQEEIVRRTTSAFERVKRLTERSHGAEAGRRNLDRSILAKAFRGELVEQDPSDEPASVLLERIRQEREAAPAKARRGRKRAKAEA
jgi:type I restriction enzyme S subunit